MSIVKNPEITHIYHLADLHIRNLQRHSEYREVFTKFLENVRLDNIETSVIYLAGDIAHAKTELSPELVREVSWILTECAKLRDTFVITGNHDCNLNNSARLDVLTPIIENLNNPNIHYLRDTGVYPFKNINWVVYSILDNKKNWPRGYDVEGDNTICVFHGPVNKAQTDIGYTVASNSFSVEMFDGVDMALLGDIHKRQVLQEFYESTIHIMKEDLPIYERQGWQLIDDCGDTWKMYKKTPHVAYAGSVIQQNHGELLEKHGYLLWDVKSRTFEEHHIFNNYGYLTIDVLKGVIPQWVYDEVDTKLPKYPRLRMRFTDTDAASMKLCITELKGLFKTTEVTVTRTDTIGQLKSNNKVNKNIVGNVSDVTFQNQLLRDYLERQFLLGDDELNAITEKNIELNGLLDDSNNIDNVLWTPKLFEFDNMFSYGEKNKVDFSKAHGIIGIFAPNAQGKSSLFDALSFCAFDRSSRTNLSKNILNNQKDNFTCKFNFDIDGVDYFIERTAKWTRKKTNLKVDVNFWKEVDGVKESLNGEQRKYTNRNIEKYLGKFEDFILTTLSLQGNNALFIDKSQTERKEILSQFIGVDIFDRLFQKAFDDNKDNSAIIRKFNKDDFTEKLATCISNTEKYSNQFDEKQKSLQNATGVVSSLNNKLIKLNGKIVKLSSDLIGIDELTKRKTILENRLKQITTDSDITQSRIAKLEELQIQLDEIIDKYDEETLLPNVNKLKSIRKKITTFETDIYKLNVKIDADVEKLEHLNSHKYNTECDVCMENSESIIESKNTTILGLQRLTESLLKYESSRDQLKENVKKFEQDEIDLNILQDSQIKETKVEREISTLLNKISQFETDSITINNQFQQQIKLIDEYHNNEKQINNNIATRVIISNTRNELKDVEKTVTKLNREVLQLNGKVSSLKSEKISIESRINEVKDLERETNVFKYLMNALGKDGISYELIEKALPMIEGEVNNILAQIVEFGMQLEIDGKNINAYLVYGDQRWSLEMCSGMERFISGLAIRVALINVCNLPRPNFLVIDEGLGTLDSSHLSQISLLFQYLKTQFDFVMVISHIENARDMVDDFIEIKKVDGFSHVKF